jgi:diaminopimelate decarboxylase
VVTFTDVERPLAARDVLHRMGQYRRAFPGCSITCPAAVLNSSDVADAVRDRGQLVDVRSRAELAFVTVLGVPASRLVVHDDGVTAAPLRCAARVGVGRVVLGCPQQVPVLAQAVARRRQPVLVDTTTALADCTAAAAAAEPRLDLVGLHATLADDVPESAYLGAVAELIARMAHVRHHWGVILVRVSLSGGSVLCDPDAPVGALHRLAAGLEDAFDDACARARFPRPALTLAPRHG